MTLLINASLVSQEDRRVVNQLEQGKSVFVHKSNQQSKADPLVGKVTLIYTNHMHYSYPFIKYNDGRESSVSLCDLALCP